MSEPSFHAMGMSATAPRMGRLIVVFGTMSGVGNTVVATNLAVGLGQRLKRPVCLVDLDVEAVGGAAKLLNLQPARVVADVLSSTKRASAEGLSVQEALLSHGSGVQVLPIFSNARQVSQLDPKVLARALSSLKSRYEYLIVDGGKAFSDALLAVFGIANLGLLVASPKTVACYQTKWALGMLESLGIPLRMMKMLLNRVKPHELGFLAAMKAAVPCELIGVIPADGSLIGVARELQTVVGTGAGPTGDVMSGMLDALTTRVDWYIEDQELLRARQAGTAAHTQAPPTDLGSRRDASEESVSQPGSANNGEVADEIARLKQRIASQLLEMPDLRSISAVSSRAQWLQLREKSERVIAGLLARELSELPLRAPEIRAHLVKEITDEALGLGPLEELLADPEVTDILVNGKDLVYVERKGRLALTTKQFISAQHLRAVIERILAPLGRHVDESNPMVDARLPDGSRVSVVIPPLAINGPQLSIRKFGRTRYTKDDLVTLGSLTSGMATFLEACVRARKSLVISGGAGSGKTTLLNVISAFIPDGERIITIEDAAELRLAQTHWVSLEARPPNIESKGEVTIRELFRHALRMRPDRIIIGECRGAETLDMLQAMNTGHDGSITTVHANAPRDVIARLDSMVLMSNVELPVRAIREMIASAVDLIVHTARLSDGSRKILAITEVMGLRQETEVAYQDLFVFRQSGVASDGAVLGEFIATGNMPTFLEDLKVKGFELEASVFANGPPPPPGNQNPASP